MASTFSVGNFNRGFEDFLAQHHREQAMASRCALCAAEEAKGKETSEGELTSTMAKTNAAGAQALNTAGRTEEDNKGIELIESLKAYPELQSYCFHDRAAFYDYAGAMDEFEKQWGKKLPELLKRAAINKVEAKELEETLAAFKKEKELLEKSVHENLRFRFPSSVREVEERVFNPKLFLALQDILEILKEDKNLGDHPLIGRILQIDKTELFTLTEEIASLTNPVYNMYSMKFFYTNKGGPINWTILRALINMKFPDCAGTYYTVSSSSKLISASDFTCKFPPTAPPAPFPKLPSM